MLPTRRSIGIFSVSQRAFAPTCLGCPVISRYMDAAVRQEKGKLCFIKRKGKLFVLNIRGFCEKKFCFLGMKRRENENLWTFLRNSSSFPSFLPSFRATRLLSSHSPPLFFLHLSGCLLLLPRLCSPRRSLACVGAPRRTPAPASRTQRVRNSSLHPSPSLLTH